MNKVFISWTDREPEFQNYLSGVNILLSPSLVAKNWNVTTWSTMPESIMVDSGTFTQSKKKGVLDVQSCIKAQLRILEGWPDEKLSFFIHYDYPLNINLPFDKYQEKVELNLKSAKEYIGDFPHAENRIPVAVIHALDAETLTESWLALKEMGYKRFALGSLVTLLFRSRDRLQLLLRTSQELGIIDLHLLGISSSNLLKDRVGLWLGSFDTSSPTRQAIAGTIVYSDPFESFILQPTQRNKIVKSDFGGRKTIQMPRPCACPVCSRDSKSLLCSEEQRARQLRKIHNAYHLIEEVKSWGV
ncbi:hypothetical protein OAH08_04635 [Verrucomicrobia bacterium]|jgi:tRNA-guanine family transglycosylase|nr:hypothetical protein [Verrucomicrobiota bacterium]